MTSKGKPFIVILAGAGASKAVSPVHYPTTVEFFNGLPEEISTHGLFIEVLQYLKSRRKIEEVDIEVVLWKLQELEGQLKSLRSNQFLLGWLLEGGRLVKWTGQQANYENLRVSASQVLPVIESLISEIDRRVYDLYRRIPERDELENNWTLLLENLGMLNSRVELVTTNYDVVLETALDFLSGSMSVEVDNGWRGSVYRKLDSTLWAMRPDPLNPGLLTKLHGSVNWARDGEQVLVGDPLFRGSHERHAIIYPGFKGRPSQEPFISMHRYFGDCLRLADVVFFIGFAFRDEFINEICERAISPLATIVVINPAEIPELPWQGREKTHHIKGFFDDQSVAASLEIVMGTMTQKS